MPSCMFHWLSSPASWDGKVTFSHLRAFAQAVTRSHGHSIAWQLAEPLQAPCVLTKPFPSPSEDSGAPPELVLRGLKVLSGSSLLEIGGLRLDMGELDAHLGQELWPEPPGFHPYSVALAWPVSHLNLHSPVAPQGVAGPLCFPLLVWVSIFLQTNRRC